MLPVSTPREAVRALLWRGAAARDATTRCAMAKRVATVAGFSIVSDAPRLHGDRGYFFHYGIEKSLRDLRVHQIPEGANDINRVIVAREITGV